MIGADRRGSHGDAGLGVWSAPFVAFRNAISGKACEPELEEPAMFRLPAYDPVGIAILGFGILAVVALAFAF